MSGRQIVIALTVLWVVARSLLWGIILIGLLFWWNPTIPTIDAQGWLNDSITWFDTHSKIIVWWYLIGILCAMYWPWKYRHQIDSWGWIIITTPFYALLGPLAILARFPI